MKRKPAGVLPVLTAVVSLTSAHAAEATSPGARPASDARRLQAVRVFADNVLQQGRDRWSGKDTPLLADGIDPLAGEPAVWRHGGEALIIHNLASQQNLFRVLYGLSSLTGEARYAQAARAAIRYHFEHLRSPCGKLRWGGHQFIDLHTLKPVGHFDANCHELKTSLPFYELLWDVDAGATAQCIRAMWKGHVIDWRTLAMNRHAPYRSEPPPAPAMWEQPYDDPAPFFDSDGLSFLNCGADLVYSAALLYRLGGEQGALDWALRLAGMYAKARHPETGMGAYQFSKPRRRLQPPEEGPLTGRLTWSSYGDRIENQFGNSGNSDPEDEFYNPVKGRLAPDGMLVAREGWVWSLSGGFPWYTLVQSALAESLGEAGAFFAADAADHLEAHARHAYDPQANHFRPMWADGTDVTGLKIPRTGYGKGSRGDAYTPNPATSVHVAAYARAYRVTRRPSLWQTARDMARGLGLGEIGEAPGQAAVLNPQGPAATPEMVFALIELHRTAPQPGMLDAARAIADRMLDARFHHGFFMPSAAHRYANVDATEPLAILALEAVLRGCPEHVPVYAPGRGYIHGQFDGHGRTYDHRAVWAQRRTDAAR